MAKGKKYYISTDLAALLLGGSSAFGMYFVAKNEGMKHPLAIAAASAIGISLVLTYTLRPFSKQIEE